MKKPTNAELQKLLDEKTELCRLLFDEVDRLKNVLDETRDQQGVVSKAEMESVISHNESLQLQNQDLHKLLENEKGYIREERERADGLLQRIAQLEAQNTELSSMRSEINTGRNNRGAGRKPFQDSAVIDRIKSMHSGGASLQAIVNTLNDEKLLTRAGNKWSKSSVHLIIKKNQSEV